MSSEMMKFHFIPPSADGGTPCRRAFKYAPFRGCYPKLSTAEQADVDGFEAFMARYRKGLAIERSAVDNLG